MRLPIFPVLGAFLFVAVFSPFVLMLGGSRDMAQVGLYLLLNVNPVAIPALLSMLGVAWICRRWATSPVASKPAVAPMPPTPVRPHRPATASPAPRSSPQRDEVIDVVAVRTETRSGPSWPRQRPSTFDPRYAVSCRTRGFETESSRTARTKALGMTAR